MDFALVRESLHEKKTLEHLAPHLVRPLPFLVPVYRGSRRGLVMVRIGLMLYDLLTPGKVTDRFLPPRTPAGAGRSPRSCRAGRAEPGGGVTQVASTVVTLCDRCAL